MKKKMFISFVLVAVCLFAFGAAALADTGQYTFVLTANGSTQSTANVRKSDNERASYFTMLNSSPSTFSPSAGNAVYVRVRYANKAESPATDQHLITSFVTAKKMAFLSSFSGTLANGYYFLRAQVASSSTGGDFTITGRWTP